MKQQPSNAAVEACVQLRSAERLLASCGCYSQAAEIRKQRESVEDCSVTSIDDLRPDCGNYSPQTIGKIVSERMEKP
jgi:hypothetical protein